jgi:aspartate-semialdehyde dehydrogenase
MNYTGLRFERCGETTMTDAIRVGIAGATGLVGEEMASLLESSSLPVSELRLFASADSAGERYAFRDLEVEVEELGTALFDGLDYILGATSADLAESYVPRATATGCRVIDNSSRFRMDDTVPLIVPEVNFAAVTDAHRIIANPNCSTIQLVPVLNALHEIGGLARVVVSSYQAVSGAGRDALDELFEETRALMNQTEYQRDVFPARIAFNCIPAIDTFLENGYTKEEMKIINESRKILGIPDLKITATCVRVPVFHGHAESVNVSLEKETSLPAVLEALTNVPGLLLFPESSAYPMQCDVAGQDHIAVGRVRRDESLPCGYNLWVVADNVRKGAALNAIQILEQLVRVVH